LPSAILPREPAVDRSEVTAVGETQEVKLNLEVTATINVPVARHWGVRIDNTDEVNKLVVDELTQREFDQEGPVLGITARVTGAETAATSPEVD
jgi:hypothetical protein